MSCRSLHPDSKTNGPTDTIKTIIYIASFLANCIIVHPFLYGYHAISLYQSGTTSGLATTYTIKRCIREELPPDTPLSALLLSLLLLSLLLLLLLPLLLLFLLPIVFLGFGRIVFGRHIPIDLPIRFGIKGVMDLVGKLRL